jgi:uncharacterized protein YxjI
MEINEGDKVQTTDGKVGYVTKIHDTRFGPLAVLDGQGETAYQVTSLTKLSQVKPTVRLSGADGNVFNIIGLCVAAARKAGWTKPEVDKLREDMFGAGSYDDVIQMAMNRLEVE